MLGVLWAEVIRSDVNYGFSTGMPQFYGTEALAPFDKSLSAVENLRNMTRSLDAMSRNNAFYNTLH